MSSNSLHESAVGNVLPAYKTQSALLLFASPRESPLSASCFCEAFYPSALSMRLQSAVAGLRGRAMNAMGRYAQGLYEVLRGI